jgi:LysM repeat protein
MKKTINYEKDILFKTNIGEICSISLEHDFTVDEGFLKGDFIVSGEYKANELSVNKEKFNYRLPLEYELEKNVNIDTISYDIENFEYNVKEDELNVYIDFTVRYEEKKDVPIIPEISEEELNTEELETFKIPERSEEEPVNEAINEEETEELPRLSTEDKETVIDAVNEEDAFVTYHVHIVREGDTLESICQKYGVTEELIKEYNTSLTLELKSKLIIPALNE